MRKDGLKHCGSILVMHLLTLHHVGQSGHWKKVIIDNQNILRYVVKGWFSHVERRAKKRSFLVFLLHLYVRAHRKCYRREVPGVPMHLLISARPRSAFPGYYVIIQ